MSLTPRRPKGPHLNALRAFEAAARLGSFTAAADELSVTPGAITQHVKALEAWADTELFIRNARGIELTALAEELLPDFILAFDQLGVAVHALRNKATPQKIKVATLPAVAQLWLAPRLGELRKVSPELSVSVTALETPPNLAREPFDISIFFTNTPTGQDEICIAPDRIFPVCTPQIARRLQSIADLSNEMLIYDATWTGDWEIWLKNQPESDGIARSGTVHSLFSVALEEARHNGGVLMAHEVLVQTLLETGDLVRPFEASVDLPSKLVARVTPTFRQSSIFQLLKPQLFLDD